MSTPIYITVSAPTGKSLWGRVRKPDGTTAAEGAVTETPVGSKVYQATLTPTLTDNAAAATPHNVEVREATDGTSFNASTTVWGPKTNFWVTNQIAVGEPVLGNLDAAVSSVGGGGGGGGSTPAQLWAYANRTLTGPAMVPAGNGNLATFNAELTAYTDARWRQTIGVSGLDSTGWTQFVLTFKVDVDDADQDALLVARVTNPSSGSDGLLLLKGAAPSSAALASISVDSITPDTQVTWTLQAGAMDLPPSPGNKPFTWELARFTGTVKEIVGLGRLHVVRSARRSVTAP